LNRTERGACSAGPLRGGGLRFGLVTLVILATLLPLRVHAHGAFPDSGQLLVSSDRPNQIIVSANFGLLVSRDSGSTWRWVCENAIGPEPSLFQLGPSPAFKLLAVSYNGLHVSADDACTWSLAGGALANASVLLAFPDPTNAQHVVAIARQRTDSGTGPMVVVESVDGGATFGMTPLYIAASKDILSGVEVSRSEPDTMYATMYTYETTPHPRLLRSVDRGGTWQTVDLVPVVGEKTVRLILVDPRDADVVYLRIFDSPGDRLAIVRDGGATVELPLNLSGPMSAFLLRADGVIIVSTKEKGASFLSTDGGRTFSAWANAPGVRGLAEVDGTIYAAADNFKDGFAVGRSRDNGQTWEPLLRFNSICGPVACENVEAVCAAPWRDLVALFGIEEKNCGRILPDTPSDPTSISGCSCSLSTRSGFDGAPLYCLS